MIELIGLVIIERKKNWTKDGAQGDPILEGNRM